MNKVVMTRYDAYKDCGVEWLGNVPEHWQVRRVKELGNLVLGKMLDNNNGAGKLFKNYLKSKNIGWLVPNVTSIEEMYFSPHEIRLYRIKQGDLLLSEGGEVGKTSFWNNDVEECYIQNSVHKLTINCFNYSRYFMYLSYAAGHLGYYDSIVNFVSIKHLTKEKLSRVIWPVPSIQEQKSIAAYLDTKTKQIDRKIDLLTQKATQYGKLKRSLINETVTRGLDKNVAMKDSGVEWIGGMPEHWQVRRVKELGNLVLGKMLDNNYGDAKLFKRYLKSKNIGWLVPNVTSVEEMYFSPYEIRLYRIKQGDLLFSEGGEVGKTSFWNDDIEECYIQNSVQKLTINRFNYSRYFMYLSYTAGHSGYYDSIVNFVSIKHLTKEKLSRAIWPVPSIQEQKAIADYLDTKTAYIDNIVTTINTQIDKLKELRKTLINDVVTGKIKVA